MSWLRIDDRFTEHPKFAGWSPAERWDWLALLCYCARYRTKGVIPLDASLLPALHSAPANKQSQGTTQLLSKAVAAGLLDETPDGLLVHDWDAYNPVDPTAAERKRRQRARDAHRDVDRDENRDNGVTVTPPRARARARVPVPSPEREDHSLSDVTLGDDVDEADRVQAWVDRSRAPDVRSPGAFTRAGVDSGEWPDEYAPSAPNEPRAVNAPVTAPHCPECDCAPPWHAVDCSLGKLA